MSFNTSVPSDFEAALQYGVARAFNRSHNKWQVTFDEVENTLDFMHGVNCSFNESVIRELWADEGEPVIKHMMEKWNSYRFGGNQYNIYAFYASLDQLNRHKLIAWYNHRMSTC